MKGILLAGGSGRRLGPLAAGTSKQLLPVYDKPLVYYPLSALITAGVRDVLLITSPGDAHAHRRLLGDGSAFGIAITHRVQTQPRGVADALVLAADFVGSAPVVLALGDNVMHAPDLATRLRHLAGPDTGGPAGAAVLACWVADPRPFGVVELDGRGRPVALVEKPPRPRSHWAVPGLYAYDGDAVAVARELRPSARGELEITDVNRTYLRAGRLRVDPLPRGTTWLDAGTPDALLEAALSVRAVEQHHGLKVGAPEEAAWRAGLLADEDLRRRAEVLAPSAYGRYLQELVERRRTTVSARAAA